MFVTNTIDKFINIPINKTVVEENEETEKKKTNRRLEQFDT